MIARATKSLKPQEVQILRGLTYRFKNIWRVALFNDGPSKVKPFKIHPLPGGVPRKAKMRR
jgi:hypothetical protein